MTSASTNELNLQAFLPYRLSIVTNKVSHNLSSLYSEKFDISIAEWRVMAVLGQTPEQSADEVCRGTQMDKVTVSRAVSKLLNKSIIKRSYAEQDRRRSILSLSRTGYGIYAQIVPMAKKYEKDLLRGLSRQDQLKLDELLGKLDQRAMALAHTFTEIS